MYVASSSILSMAKGKHRMGEIVTVRDGVLLKRFESNLILRTAKNLEHVWII
jgi:hypothetical protein